MRRRRSFTMAGAVYQPLETEAGRELEAALLAFLLAAHAGHAGHPAELLHHLAGGIELLQEVVHLADAGARSPSHPGPAAAREHPRLPPLVGGHRADDGLDPHHVLLVDL